MDGQDFNFDIEDDELDPFANASITNPQDVIEEDDSDFDPFADEAEQEEEDVKAPEEEAPAETTDEAETPEEDKPEEPEAAPDLETFQKLAEDLTDMGILYLEEGEEKITIDSIDKFAQRVQKSYEHGAMQHINSVVGKRGPQYAEAWNLIFEQGLDPFEYFTRQAEIANFEDLDLTNEDVQKNLYREFHRRQGLAPERVEAKLQRLIDTDDEALAEEVKDYQQILIKQSQQAVAAEAEAAQKRYEAEQAQQNQYIQSVHQVLGEKLKDKDFDGIPITEADATKVMDFFSTPKWQLPNGQVITDADRWWMEMRGNPALAAKFGLMATMGFDTSRIEKKSVSKQTAKLFNNLTQQNKVVNRQKAATPQKATNSFFD